MNKCPASFNQLYIHSTGKVYPCSFLQNDPLFELGDITCQTLENIWESEKLKKFRDIHLNLESSSRCCLNQKKYLCDKLNTRTFFNDTDGRLKRVDIMLDSFCNLVCIMCTNIYDETGGFKKAFFWQNNAPALASLTEVEIVGGEPLISPHFFNLVDKVLLVNKTCEWKVTTNANFPITPRLEETLKKLTFTTFAVSLDSLKKETFEKIRQNSNHDLVMKNIEHFTKLEFNLSINMVVQKLNHNEVFEIYEWSSQRGLKFYPILLTHPALHSLLSLPENEQVDIIKKLITKNNITKSIEIFFLIKKLLHSTLLKTNTDVLKHYREHLLGLNIGHE